MAATVSGATADFVKGTSPKFSMITIASAPPSSKARASSTAPRITLSMSPTQRGEPGKGSEVNDTNQDAAALGDERFLWHGMLIEFPRGSSSCPLGVDDGSTERAMLRWRQAWRDNSPWRSRRRRLEVGSEEPRRLAAKRPVELLIPPAAGIVEQQGAGHFPPGGFKLEGKRARSIGCQRADSGLRANGSSKKPPRST